MLDPKITEALQKAKKALEKAMEDKYRMRNEQDRQFMIANLGKDIGEALAPIQFLMLEKLDEQGKAMLEELKSTLNQLKIEAPNVNVTVPEVKIPDINVPPMVAPEIKTEKLLEVIVKAIETGFKKQAKPAITINPTFKIPEIKVPEAKITIPDSIMADFARDPKRPMPMVIVDPKGQPIYNFGGGGGRGSVVQAPSIETDSAPITAASSGENTVIAGRTGFRICVFAYNMQAHGTVTSQFLDGASGPARTGIYTFQAREGMTSNTVVPPYALFKCGPGKALILNLSDAITMGGSVSYFYEKA